MDSLRRPSMEEVCSAPDMLLYSSESSSPLPEQAPKTLKCPGECCELSAEESHYSPTSQVFLIEPDYSPTSQVFPIEPDVPVTPKAKRVCGSSQPIAHLPSIFLPTPDITPQRGVKRSAQFAQLDATPPRGSKRRAPSNPPDSPPFDYRVKPCKIIHGDSNLDSAWLHTNAPIRGALTLDSPWWHTDHLQCTVVRGFRYTWVPKLSADELKRVSEAVLHQIDWTEVAEYVASNRGPQAYRRATKAVLQNKIDELVDVEEFYECYNKRIEEWRNS